MQFKDYYSKQAKEYSKYRPQYPDGLFTFLNSITSQHKLAVDCATGSGQAAIGLAKYFDKVIALDASKLQIENAFKNPQIEYKVATAESTGLEDKCADLVCIATAIHWVDQNKFYDEVKRILTDDGVFAAWTYGTATDISPPIDEIINTFSREVLHQHWDRGIEQVWKFEDIEFPFEIIQTPEFEIRKNLTSEDFLNYMYTWSSVHKYIEVHNVNPVDILKKDLVKVWGNERREVRWSIKSKMGKKS